MSSQPRNIPGIAERLAEARKVLKLTQEELASRLGISVRTYKHSEQGERVMGVDEIVKLGELGVDMVWLMTGHLRVREDQTPYLPSIDPEIMGRVVDAVAKLYKEENQALAPIDQGRIAAEIYPALAAIEDEAERRGALRYAIELRRAGLREALRDPASSKLRA